MPEKSNPGEQAGEFDLGRPTGQVGSVRASGVRPATRPSESTVATPAPDDPSLPHAGWRGLEDGDDGDEPGNPDNVDFGGGKFRSDGEMDMTPMVDVTFLLLIFFMVTAAFSLMRTHEQPKPNVEDPSSVVEQPPEDDNLDYCEVIIDQNGSYFVTSRGEEEVEAPSETEMRALVRNAKENDNVDRLIVTCHVDSKHSRFVAAWDAGLAAGISELQRRTTEEDY
jgi:biopolymer transport protein ExbD